MAKTIRNKKRVRKNKTLKKNKIYTKKDFNSGDGMLTSVWGPSLWHSLHTISFNYPVNPTKRDKKNYKDFVLSLKYILPCKYCRMNFKKNIKEVPLTQTSLKNRHNFSKWMYCFHEHINKMLKKKSGLKYNDVRERYEHFRSRCTLDPTKTKHKQTRKNKKRKKKKNKSKKEKGCVEPLYGKKSKCIIKIVPKNKKVPTFQMDKSCKKKRNI
tara:strand:+ start:1243 stop:1878 length:636 start_codon:yes stop_codon:yes gene_type:complete